jgi:hypothetical protein
MTAGIVLTTLTPASDDQVTTLLLGPRPSHVQRLDAAAPDAGLPWMVVGAGTHTTLRCNQKTN